MGGKQIKRYCAQNDTWWVQVSELIESGAGRLPKQKNPVTWILKGQIPGTLLLRLYRAL